MSRRSVVNRFELAREELLEQLRAKGIRDENVLAAIAKVPRQMFVSELFASRAYEDTALPIDCNQTISQPFTVAMMTQLLKIRKGDKVLEIGTGSGYQAALLATMGARVFTIERYPELMKKAEERFKELGLKIATHIGDGSVGWSRFAPFDKIMVTAGAPEVPPSLTKQLKDGGIMVIPVGDRKVQTMMLVERRGKEFFTREVDGFRFVPLVGKEGWQD